MALLRSLSAFAVVAAAAAAAVEAPAPEAVAPGPPPSTRRALGAPVKIGGIVGLGALATPVVRRAVGGTVRRLLGRDDGLGDGPPSASESAAKGAAPSAAPPSASAAAQRAEMEADAEKFALTPEKLATIAELNPQLEALGDQLAAVPVFTAAVGNGTSPLTVPAEDGTKLAYFFTEHADAEAFLAAVRENTGAQLEANVIGVSLADIVRAYATPAAKEAKETFVLIPTMAEVAAARQLLKMGGADPSADPAALGPGSGLIPVFWSEALAVQTAGGQQRKVLFFRIGDLQHMWKNLSDARQAAGELDELPEGPTVQVSDLQTMASLLVQANKTDDVMFLPSSTALRRAQQGQAAGARAAPGGGAAGARRAAAPPADDDDDTMGTAFEEDDDLGF